MKKLIIFLILLLAWPCFGATYYVTQSGTGDGTTYAQADSIANFNAGNGNFAVLDGDTVYLCDTITTAITIPDGGADEANRVYIRGDYTDHSGIVDARDTVTGWDTSGNWTQDGAADRWYIDSSGFTYSDPFRMWFTKTGDSGLTEGQEVAAAASVDAEYKWHHDAGNTDIYVYATSNPASYFSAMKGLVESARAVYVGNYDYIDIRNLTVYGGHWAGVYLEESQYINVFNNTVKRTKTGIHACGKKTANYDVYSRVNIYDNTVDSDYVLDNASNITTGIHDGISLANGCQYCKVYSNTIKNWGHTGIALGGEDNTKWAVFSSDHEIYDNDVSCPDLEYGRGLEIYGTDGRSQNNLIYRNNFHDLRTRIQFNGNDNTFYSNWIWNIVNPTRVGATDTGQGIRFYTVVNSYGHDSTCYNNKILNNTFAQIDEAGVDFPTALAAANVHSNTVQNNVIFDCGNNSVANPFGLIVRNNALINNNTISNNDIYNATRGAGNEVHYRGVVMTVATMNTSDAQGDTIADNIQADPKLISSTDFHLLVSSPCIGTGTPIPTIVKTDIDGQPTTDPHVDGRGDIGADRVMFKLKFLGE